jgi:hypothetical protein
MCLKFFSVLVCLWFATMSVTFMILVLFARGHPPCEHLHPTRCAVALFWAVVLNVFLGVFVVLGCWTENFIRWRPNFPRPMQSERPTYAGLAWPSNETMRDMPALLERWWRRRNERRQENANQPDDM